MKIRTLIVCLLCALLLIGCGKGDAAQAVEPAPSQIAVGQASVPEATPQGQQKLVIAAATKTATEPPVTKAPTPEPTPVPTPEPTATPVPKLGVLDGKFADKFVTGEPVLIDTAETKSYQTETLAIFITHVVDDSKTLTNHTYQYYMADVYFQNMEDLRSCAAKSWNWEERYKHDWLKNIAKSHDAIFAVSGDFTLNRKTGLIIRNGEEITGENGSTHQHDPQRDVGVIYRDGHMETYFAKSVPAEEILNDPNVWQVLGFGPALLDENGQPLTTFNDPNKVSRANIRNAVGYFEPGHYCFVYVPPYLGPKDKKPKDDSCIELEGLSKLMYSLGCVRAYNLDGGATAGMYFNGKQVIGGSLGQGRKNHDIYYIPQA